MQVRGVVIVTIALFLGIAALVLHLCALRSSQWKITKRDREPKMEPVTYGIWQRCEHINVTIIKQGVALGTRQHVQVCQPNRYMRYSPDKFNVCYNIRRNCPFIGHNQLPEGCSCCYLPSAKALQWLTVLAAIFLILGLLLLYLKTITSPQNNSAVLVLNYAPFIIFLLTFILMVTGLIVFGAYFRRDTYEDYSFPLQTISNDSRSLQSFDLHSLHNYVKHHEAKFDHDRYKAAERELRTDANTHYHTIIGWATGYEIIATVLVFFVTALTLWLGTTSRSEDI